MSNPRHNRGHSGEQDMGFYFGEKGYFFVDGPSGAAGHGVTEAGLDGVAYHPETKHLVIYDNKSFKRAGNVSGATAIDKNLLKNLDDCIVQVRQMEDLPHKDEILEKLTKTRAAVEKGSRTGKYEWPDNVQIAVSNAGGRSTGVTKKMEAKGIDFVDYNQAPDRNDKPASPKLTGGGVKVKGARGGKMRIITKVRLKGVAKVTGRGLAGVAFSFLLGWLKAKYVDEPTIKWLLKGLDDEVEADLLSTSALLDAVILKSQGKQPWANIHFVLIEEFWPEDQTLDAHFTAVELKSVTVSTKKIEEQGKFDLKRHGLIGAYHHHYTVSAKMNLPEEAVATYDSFRPMIQSYTDRLSGKFGRITTEERWELRKERTKLLLGLCQALYSISVFTLSDVRLKRLLGVFNISASEL